MSFLTILLVLIAVMLVYMTGWYLLSIWTRDASVIDIAWGLGFVLVAWLSLVLGEKYDLRAWITTILVTVWGLRLAWHIYTRNKGRGEDWRYKEYRQDWGVNYLFRSFFRIFMLQGFLLLVIALPVIFINAYHAGYKANLWYELFGLGKQLYPLNIFNIFGIGLWLFGFIYEAVADFQLARFKQDPANEGEIMTEGLWKFSRHPNYFGEVVLWWGIFLLALFTPESILTVVGPVTITYLILKVSGVPLLEKRFNGDPEYEAYKQRTSIFWPRKPGKNY